MTGSRSLALAVILAALSIRSGVAWAEFGDVRRVHDGTAYTLEKGEFSVGILGPMQFGVLDELTVVTHPVLHLLLTPNIVLRGKVLDGPVTLALNLGYIQTFLDPRRLDFPGTVSFYPLVTVPLSSRVALSGQVGYLLDVSPVSHGVLFGGGVAVLVSPSDLLNLQVQDEYERDPAGLRRPTVLFTYTHAFYRLHLRAGVAVGRFPIQVGSASTDIRNLPAYPIVDLVWVL